MLMFTSSTSGPRLNIKAVFPGIGIPIIKIRWSSDHLIFYLDSGNHYSGKTTSFYIHHCRAVCNIVILDHVQIRLDCIYIKDNSLQAFPSVKTPVVWKTFYQTLQGWGLINLTNKSFQWGSNICLGPSCFELDQYGEDCISLVRDSSCTRNQ